MDADRGICSRTICTALTFLLDSKPRSERHKSMNTFLSCHLLQRELKIAKLELQDYQEIFRHVIFSICVYDRLFGAILLIAFRLVLVSMLELHGCIQYAVVATWCWVARLALLTVNSFSFVSFARQLWRLLLHVILNLDVLGWGTEV